MSRDPVDDQLEELDDEPRGDPSGRLRTTGPSALVICLVVGLVAGWAVRPIAAQLETTAPRVTWLQASAFFVVAVLLAAVARATARAVHQAAQRGGLRLRPHEAVNRLVLAKSCALTGALAGGGYLGYALTWVGSEAELASERIVRSLVAALGAALTVVAALLLERACRVRGGDRES